MLSNIRSEDYEYVKRAEYCHKPDTQTEQNKSYKTATNSTIQ